MTKTRLILTIAAVGLLAFGQSQAQVKPKPGTTTKTTPKPFMLKTSKDKLGYAIGLNIAKNMKQQGVNDSITVAALAKALEDIFKGNQPLLSDAEAGQILQEFSMSMQAKMSAEQSKAGQANAEAGRKFLEENKKKPGVVVLPSGLQYVVIKEGTGAMPTATDKVKTHYHGTLITGEVFDSSVERGEPISFPVNGVIKGWTEALQLMKVGSKWKLFIPSDLAYGERGAGQQIGPNSALIFEVELLDIEK